MGAGAAEGSADASNMLKPQLARGELHTIGATTLDEYRKYIEKDAALERRFQPVMVEEPSVEDTIAILRGLKERYEVHHGVRIQDAALIAAATLIATSAIDSCQTRLWTSSTKRLAPQDRARFDAYRNRPARAPDHAAGDGKTGAQKRTGHRQQGASLQARKELADLKEQSSRLKAQWQKEKEEITKSQRIGEQIDQLRTELEQAQREETSNALRKSNMEKSRSCKNSWMT